MRGQGLTKLRSEVLTNPAEFFADPRREYRLFVPIVIAVIAGLLAFTASLVLLLAVVWMAPEAVSDTVTEIDPYLWLVVGSSPALLWVFATASLRISLAISGIRGTIRELAVLTGWGMLPLMGSYGLILVWSVVAVAIGHPVVQSASADALFAGVPVFFQSPFVLFVYGIGVLWTGYIWAVGIQEEYDTSERVARAAASATLLAWLLVRAVVGVLGVL